MDFTALDFETANYQPSSACAVGAAVVRGGRVVHVTQTLIRPPTLEFYESLTAIHGITAEKVMNAPTFAQIWPELERLIGDGPIAMHNASFDLRVLVASLELSNIALPELRYFCTLEMARTLLPGLPNHRLSTLSKVFGIPLEHHDAASDAIACAELGIILIRLSNCRGLHDYLHNVATDYLAQRAECTCRSVIDGTVSVEDWETEEYKGAKYEDFVQLAHAPDRRFEGMCFVFTGELSFLTRSEAIRIVELRGAKATNSVSKNTTYVVVGDDAWMAYKRNGKPTGKLAKALELQQAGAQLKIIREEEFLVLCARRL